jgi:hypothetical protein
LRSYGFACGKEILEKVAGLTCNVTRYWVLREILESHCERARFCETKQAQDVEPVFVLSACVVILALVNLVELGDEKRRDAGDVDVERSIFARFQ